MTIYAILIVYADRHSVLFEKVTNPNLSQFHLIFSFILTIIISFRVNTSYARWWEGRILWGCIVNNCRNISLKFNVFVGFKSNCQFYDLLHYLPVIIKASLRNDEVELNTALRTLDINDNPRYPILYVMKRLYSIINELRDNKDIRWEQYTALDNHLVNLMDLVGGCERIANTPVPPVYAIFVKQTLLFYALIFPVGWVDTFGFFIVPVMIMIIYILLGLEILSEELEQPFEPDDHTLCLDVIVKNIEENIDFIKK